jgi:hypothetical protein
MSLATFGVCQSDERRTGGLISLWEMLIKYADFFGQIALFDEAVYRIRLEEAAEHVVFGDEEKPDWTRLLDLEFWARFRALSNEIDLDSVVAQVDRICGRLRKKPKPSYHDLDTLFRELIVRIKEQLNSRMFLHIPAAKAKYWEKEILFGEEVFAKIPEAANDIFEAGSCFAAGRPGGTVYHCVGIMQAALFKVGDELGCTIDLQTDDWGNAFKKIQDARGLKHQEAESHRKAGDLVFYEQWKIRDASYAELVIYINAVKIVWRHPHAHYRQVFTLEHAEKIISKVEEFVRYAATLLP